MFPPVSASASAPTSAPQCLARLEDVSLYFGNRPVFKNLSLCLYKGEHVALLGANGTGKSTLLRLLQGEIQPSTPPAGEESSGNIYWDFEGVEEPYRITALQHVRLVSPAQQKNYVRQGWNITGQEIVLSGLGNSAMLYGEAAASQSAQVAELAIAAQAEHLMEMPAPAMSQGQLRLVLILRALISKPPLLLLDEPFDGLDTAARARILACMDLAVENGSTLLISAHRAKDIPPFVSCALRIEHGQISRLPYPLPVSVIVHTPVTMPALPLDFPAPANLPDASCHTSAPVLELEQVDVYKESQHILYDIHWRVHKGEHWLITGSNGSGKSTLLRLLYGDEFAAYGGSIRWNGGPRPTLAEWHNKVGFVTDNLQYTYTYDLSAQDVVISGLRGTIGLYPDFSDQTETKHGMAMEAHTEQSPRVTPQEQTAALAWLEAVGLGCFAATSFHSLSSGMARRVLLARALANAPSLLLLDEPCSGLDAVNRGTFLQALPLLAKQGITLLYVSHNEDEHLPVFTHMLHLEHGKVISAGPR